MKATFTILAAIAMTGCAPMTPQEAAVLMYMNPGVYSTGYAPRPVVAPQPVYIEQSNPWPVQQMRPQVTCTTTNGGYSLYTTCR